MADKVSYTPIGYQQISTLTAAVGLTAPRGARGAIITVETQGVRWRDDGTNPTAAIGMPVAAGTTFEYNGDVTKIKFIEQAASAKLNVAYF
jgi:hypothetical protein